MVQISTPLGWPLTGEWAPVRRFLPNYFDLLFTSRSQYNTVVVFPYQTVWQYSDGNPIVTSTMLLCNERQSRAASGRPRLEWRLIHYILYHAPYSIVNWIKVAAIRKPWSQRNEHRELHAIVAWSSDVHDMLTHCLAGRKFSPRALRKSST